ncbi:MAG: hypothetical protein IH948_01930 [Bacteroidetes bacterium]|nr:hypothetical protein [Bacteroidota bacterium]
MEPEIKYFKRYDSRIYVRILEGAITETEYNVDKFQHEIVSQTIDTIGINYLIKDGIIISYGKTIPTREYWRGKVYLWLYSKKALPCGGAYGAKAVDEYMGEWIYSCYLIGDNRIFTYHRAFSDTPEIENYIILKYRPYNVSMK